MNSTVLAWVSLLTLAGCSNSVEQESGAGEPIRLSVCTSGAWESCQTASKRVSTAQFYRGALPVHDSGPRASLDTGFYTFFQGAQGRNISGLAEAASYTIGMRLKDVGSGYWVFPVDIPSQETQEREAGMLTWGTQFDISRDCPIGSHVLEFAAADGQGNFGPAWEHDITVVPAVPEGKKVISLAWSNRADLDLHITAPNGKELTPKQPTTATIADAGVYLSAKCDADAGTEAQNPPGIGVLDRDSNQNCVFDGFMREDVVFCDDPTPGLYQIRADLYNACGEAATTFRVELWEDGVLSRTRSGQLLDINADQGGPGLFVTEFSF